MNQRTIQSIETRVQPSEPLPKDKVVNPVSGRPGLRPYMRRHRYLYRWPNQFERDLDKIKLYQGTVRPLASQVRFYRTRQKKIIPIFEYGHKIEPPMLKDCQIPHATIVISREYLSRTPGDPTSSLTEFPPSGTAFSGNEARSARHSAPLGNQIPLPSKRKREHDDIDGRQSECHGPKRPRSLAKFAHLIYTRHLRIQIDDPLSYSGQY